MYMQPFIHSNFYEERKNISLRFFSNLLVKCSLAAAYIIVYVEIFDHTVVWHPSSMGIWSLYSIYKERERETYIAITLGVLVKSIALLKVQPAE